MHDLIKIENTPSGPSLRDTPIGDESVPTVSARELHEFLESKQDFSTWIKKRIEKLRLLENKDFCSVPQKNGTLNSKGKKGVSVSIEYFLTLDIAKHIALMENTDRGFEVRDYFIECEKKLQQALSSKYNYQLGIINASTEKERMIAFNNYEVGYVQPLEQFKEEALPKVDIYDAIIESKNTFSMANTAQIINIEKMGRNKLLAWLRAKNILKSDNTPYQKYINKGWFEVRVTPTVNGPKPCSRTTPKGIEGILRLLEP